MTKRNEILVPVGLGSVERYGLEFKAIPSVLSDQDGPKKGRGKHRPCRVEVVQDGKTFVLEAAHDGRNSSKYEVFGTVYLRYEGTTHVEGKNQNEPQRVAVIKVRETDTKISKNKKRTSFKRKRMNRSLAEEQRSSAFDVDE